MRSGRSTSGPSPGCRRESGLRGVNVRVAARAGGEGRRTETTDADIRAARGERDARKGTRLAYFPEYRRPMRTPVFDRYMLRPGDRFPGPAIVEERESTARSRPRAEHHAAERDTETPVSPTSAVS